MAPETVCFTREELASLTERAVKAAIKEVEADFNTKLAHLKADLMAANKAISSLKLEVNHLEQYSRRSHLRIHGLHQAEGTSCKEVVAKFLGTMKSRDGAPIAVNVSDIDAAHPLPLPRKQNAAPGAQAGAKPASIPSIIVRFHQRDLRDQIVASRRCLKRSGVSISEDLTRANAALLRRLKNAPSVKDCWSWQGKVYGLVEGIKKPQRFDIMDEL